MINLAGKSAVILGASDPAGMGAATARRLVQSGAKVMIGARRESELNALAEQLGTLATVCDITDEHSVDAFATAATGAFGAIDIAVNFAGANVGGAIDELTEDAFMPSVKLHLIGTGLFIKHMARRMDRGGAIVTTSSVTAALAPPGLAIYASTKAGADQIVRIAANELGSKGIRVNSVSPGFTRSPITEPYFGYDGMIRAMEAETPLGRLGTVDDIAGTVLWLVSDDCFSTGQIIQANGGATLRRIPTEAEMFS